MKSFNCVCDFLFFQRFSATLLFSLFSVSTFKRLSLWQKSISSINIVSVKSQVCSCILLYVLSFSFFYINLGIKDPHCTMLLPTAITSACLLLWDQEQVWMTLMKEDAHPCTMQLHQTQMASKYHVVRMKDYHSYKPASSIWMATLWQIYISLFVLFVVDYLL